MTALQVSIISYTEQVSAFTKARLCSWRKWPTCYSGLMASPCRCKWLYCVELEIMLSNSAELLICRIYFSLNYTAFNSKPVTGDLWQLISEKLITSNHLVKPINHPARHLSKLKVLFVYYLMRLHDMNWFWTVLILQKYQGPLECLLIDFYG